MLLLIDNYDSFVHNLARYLEELGCDTRVVRNDAMSVDELIALKPQAIVLSPGPCTPKEAGVCEGLIRRCVGKIPILGVCLGHQAIASALGGRVIRANRPVHGNTSIVRHDGSLLFASVPNPLRVMRYHSLIIDESSLPEACTITARTESGIPMAIANESARLFGVQFHPESILTQHGHQILANFLSVASVSMMTNASSSELECEIDQGLWEQPFDR